MNVNKIRRPADMERITTPKLAKAFIEEQVVALEDDADLFGSVVVPVQPAQVLALI